MVNPLMTYSFSRSVAHLLKCVAITVTEDIAQIGRERPLVSMIDLGEQVAFQVCDATLQGSLRELLSHHRVKSLDAVRDKQADFFLHLYP